MYNHRVRTPVYMGDDYAKIPTLHQLGRCDCLATPNTLAPDRRCDTRSGMARREVPLHCRLGNGVGGAAPGPADGARALSRARLSQYCGHLPRPRAGDTGRTGAAGESMGRILRACEPPRGRSLLCPRDRAVVGSAAAVDRGAPTPDRWLLRSRRSVRGYRDGGCHPPQ
jgi:hypothetical protein